jgi:hypothetical protein
MKKILVMSLMLVFITGCGQKVSWKGPSATHETHTRTTIDLGGFGANTGVGKSADNALNNDCPTAPENADVPAPMFSNQMPKKSSSARDY